MLTFDSLYEGRGSGKNAGIDAAYSPPERFAHAEMARVARFAGQGDGQDVEVYEERWPASFWTVRALAEGFCLSTGSGFEAGKLAFAIARAIAAGKLGLCDALPAHTETAHAVRFAGQGDGQDVELYEGDQGQASPWIVKAGSTPNSIGVVNEGFCLAIGAGSLAFAVAQAISEGMLGLATAQVGS
jgi:hypothetical protein